MSDYYASYHFRVDFGIENKYLTDNGFKSVSGINFALEIEEKEGNGTEKLETIVNTTYGDLVLTRAMTKGSELMNWLYDQSLNQRKVRGPLVVSLLNEKNAATCAWTFINAYPTKWATDTLDAEKSGLVMETVTFKYDYYTQEEIANT